MKKHASYLVHVGLSLFAIVCIAFACCSSSQRETEKKIVVGAGGCVEQAAQDANGHVDVLGVAVGIFDLVTKFAHDPGQIVADLEPYIVKYGPGLVRCTIDKMRAQHEPTGKAAADAIFIATTRVMAMKGWE